MVRMKMNEINNELTKEEIEELEAVDKRPIVYDEDSPEMTAEMLKEFHSFDSVPIKVSRDMIKLAKTYDKDYLSFLSRLLELAFHDNELLKKCI